MKPMRSYLGLGLLYLASVSFPAFLAVRGTPLYDTRPTVNLALRCLLMDLLPILWVLPWFWGKVPPAKVFFQNLWLGTFQKPLDLAAPILASILFFLESIREVMNPTRATPTSWDTVLWMQAATTLVAVQVLKNGTALENKRVVRPLESFYRVPVFLAWGMILGGLGFHLKTDCDISRLLVLTVFVAWGIQRTIKVVRFNG